MKRQEKREGSAVIGREFRLVDVHDLPPEMRRRIVDGICQEVASTLIEEHKDELIRKISTEIKKERDISEEVAKEEIVVLERIDEEEAKKKIRKYLQLKKSKGETKVDDIEMMEELGIPIEQINEIINESMIEEG